MNNVIEEVLFSEAQIREKIDVLGKQISDDYRGQPLIVVGVIKGGAIFTADLIRAIDIPVQLDFIAVSSYGASSQSSGTVTLSKEMSTDIEGKNIIIAEDIIDTGYTLKKLIDYLKLKNPKSIKICTLLDKPARRKVEVDVDYIGFEIPDKFVVGYGLDYAEKYRNLPYIGILKPEIYE